MRLRTLDEAYESGRLPKSEHELEALVVRHELDAIYRRLGHQPPSARPAAGEASDQPSTPAHPTRA